MQQRIFILGFTLLLCFLTACKDEVSKQSQTETKESKQENNLLQQEIRFPKNEILLTEEAKKESEKWMLYIAMESEVDRLKNYNVEDVIANAPSILRASDTLMKTIPKKFRTKPIESRIKVLHTKASVLNQLSQKRQKDLAIIKATAEEIPVDFFNLKIQLNEVYIELPDLETLQK
jgi:hypothetical protein